MATRTVIELIDDLDGSEATETVYFGLDGADYVIDLAGQNADELRGLLARFVEAARKTGGTKQAPAVRRLHRRPIQRPSGRGQQRTASR